MVRSLGRKTGPGKLETVPLRLASGRRGKSGDALSRGRERRILSAGSQSGRPPRRLATGQSAGRETRRHPFGGWRHAGPLQSSDGRDHGSGHPRPAPAATGQRAFADGSGAPRDGELLPAPDGDSGRIRGAISGTEPGESGNCLPIDSRRVPRITARSGARRGGVCGEAAPLPAVPAPQSSLPAPAAAVPNR